MPDRIVEALASSPRWQILAYLSDGKQSTSDLARRFAMSAPAISRHLKRQGRCQYPLSI
jgi:DNA-binding transcriptional ArsR family regulator